jgi:phage shock protein PspC (stress-responsive transcriptional regulator)
MNKTISIHIQGFAFLLEEQAYELLHKYLNDLATVLKHELGKEEILQDIELRIVELLQQKLVKDMVIQQDQIQRIIQLLGTPEDFGAEGVSSEDPKVEKMQAASTAQKRFFRDTDSAILGGVASGVAAYFNLDVVLVRVGFVLFTMAFGSGIPLYLLLWIVTPRAKTASDKLQMKGVPVNVESIKSEFKETAERLEKKTKKWSDHLRPDAALSKSTKRFLNFILKTMGAVFVFWGFSSLISVLFFLFIDPHWIPAQINGEFTSLGELGKLFFETTQILDFLYLGSGLLTISIALLSIAIGIRLLMQLNRGWFRAILAFLSASAIIGVIILTIVTISTIKSFAVDGSLSAEVGTYHGDSLQLNIDTDVQSLTSKPNRLQKYSGNFKPIQSPNQGLLFAENGRIYNGGIAIEYTTSDDSLYHIGVEKKANGSSYVKANRRASHIYFPLHLNAKGLNFSSGFSFPIKDRYRDQEVVLKIAVPKGRVVVHKNRIVYPYASQDISDQMHDHAFVYSNGNYSAW